MDNIQATIDEVAHRVAGLDYQDAQEKLADLYRLAQLLILDAVHRQVIARPEHLPYQLIQLLDTVTKRVHDANRGAKKWMTLRTPEAFAAGLRQAREQLGRQGVERAVEASFDQVNAHALQESAANSMQHLLQASRTMEDAVKREIRRAVHVEVRGAVAAGWNGPVVAKRLAEQLQEKQIFGVTDKRGRYIPMDQYARIVGNTVLREVHTKGFETQMGELGQDLVRISTHLHRPDRCSPLEGKVYSISGKSQDYPMLPMHTPFHPNCRHVETPFVEAFRSAKELARIREESNRPDQITVYPQKSLDDLEAQQKRRQRFMRVKRELRRADEREIVEGKRLAPKTLEEQAAYERSLTARANGRIRRLDATLRERPTLGMDAGALTVDVSKVDFAGKRYAIVGRTQEHPLVEHEGASSIEVHGTTIPVSGFSKALGEDKFLQGVLSEMPAAHVQGLQGVEFTNNRIVLPPAKNAEGGDKTKGKVLHALYDDERHVIILSRDERQYYPEAAGADKGRHTIQHEFGHHWDEVHATPKQKASIDELGFKYKHTVGTVKFKRSQWEEARAEAYALYIEDHRTLALKQPDLYDVMDEIHRNANNPNAGPP